MFTHEHSVGRWLAADNVRASLVTTCRGLGYTAATCPSTTPFPRDLAMSTLPLRPSALLLLLTVVACNKGEVDTGGEPPTVPPALLAMDDPAPAAWLAAGPNTVSGRSTSLSSVTVNGVDMTQNTADETWSGSVTLDRGVSLLTAVGTEADGDTLQAYAGVIAGEYGDPGLSVEDAIALRVNESGLQELMGLVSGFLTVDFLREAALGANPIFSTSFAGVDIDANITDLDFGAPEITADPVSDRIALSVVIPDFSISADVVTSFFTASLFATASAVEMEGALVIDAVDGALSVELIDTDLGLTDLEVGISGWADWLNTAISFIVGLFEESLVGFLLEQLDATIPPLLDDALAGLDPSFTTELLGKELTLEASFADVSIDTNGIAILLDANVTVPSESGYTYAGYLLAEGGAAEVSTAPDIGAALSDDLLNRLFFELWRGGMLKLAITSEEQPALALLFTKLKATGGTIAVDARLPPVIVEKDGALQLQICELDTQISTPDGEFGTELTLALCAWVEITPVVADGVLSVELGEADFSIVVRDSNWGTSTEAITNLVAEALPEETVKLLLNAAVSSALQIELPVLFGLAFESGTVTRDESGVHTDVAMDVTYVGEAP